VNRRALPIREPHSEPPVEWTVIDLFAIFGRRRAWIMASLFLSGATALSYWLCATPRYRATAIIEVQKESHGTFGLENNTTDKQATAISDSFDDNLNLQTEIGILESDAVTLDVVGRTRLEDTPDYFAPRSGRAAFLHKVPLWGKPLEPLSIPLESAPNRRFAAIRIFAAHRKIAPEAGTRLISISYSDPDPNRAAAVVNELIRALSDYDFRSRSTEAAQAASWLSIQLGGLKQQTDLLDSRTAALDRTVGDYSDDASHNPVLARLDSLNTALAAAESNRIVREAIWRTVQSGDPETISGLAGTPNAGPNTQNSLALLQSLRAQESALQSQIAESANRYGENWPAFAEQRANLESIQNSIQGEIHRLGERARTDYGVAVQAEESARDAYTQQKNLASRLTGSALTLRLARQEADQSRALYTTLLVRLQETGILKGLHSDNFAVVSPAFVPPPDRPTSPNWPILATLAVGVGTLLGCGAAIVRELTDRAIHTAAELEAVLEARLFVAVPPYRLPETWYHRLLSLPSRSPLVLQAGGDDTGLEMPRSETPFVEALHRLRASLLLSHSERPPQVITITGSCGPGKAARTSRGSGPPLALGLATILAQRGDSVLYVDADLRSAPDICPSEEPGLSAMLSSDRVAVSTQSIAGLPTLSVVHAGARSPCPSELIASPRMSGLLTAWRDEFRFIVLQSPAAIFADALVLAQLSDAVLVTAQAGDSVDEILAAHRTLSDQISHHAVLGVVLENVNTRFIHARA